ncbi:hypothetical protein INT47_004906 [Mucor saturninus]|uniref:Aldehyde dehydrogenase n=1 Tax=Mucor saturninus TaxID=64648 RepID=A0A8H7R236_9FUNG|nr:hypothetical protein INT47_004906 [Mucor saturninus]
MALVYNTTESIEDYVTCLRGIYTTGKSRDKFTRKFYLERLYNLVKENEEQFYVALAKDLNKSRAEALASEISPVLEECVYFLNNFENLTNDQKVKPRLGANYTDSAYIRPTWNYPLQLSLVPLAGALAAGNCVVLKLSEISVHTSALITHLLPRYLDPNLYRVVNGAVEQTQYLIQQKFNHIFYTGNSQVARSIMAAASVNLTPVTLELGGKSPAIVTQDSDMQIVANRVAYGKFFNAGQSCVAVDYVLIPQSRLTEFTQAIQKTLSRWYGSDPQRSKDYGRIVNTRHFDRLLSMMHDRQSGDIVLGGDSDRDSLYIAPTVIANVKFFDPVLMADEVFGPILPVITYTDMEEALGLISRHEPPLALYLFTKKQALIDRVLDVTTSGGVTINDTLLHQNEYALPFGGVGSSGMGSYHGEKSFQTFSQERAVLSKKQQLEWLMGVRYPPASQAKLALLRAILVTHPLQFRYILFKKHVKWVSFLLIMVCVLIKRHLSKF